MNPLLNAWHLPRILFFWHIQARPRQQLPLSPETRNLILKVKDKPREGIGPGRATLCGKMLAKVKGGVGEKPPPPNALGRRRGDP